MGAIQGRVPLPRLPYPSFRPSCTLLDSRKIQEFIFSACKLPVFSYHVQGNPASQMLRILHLYILASIFPRVYCPLVFWVPTALRRSQCQIHADLRPFFSDPFC
jgi:hypothetical protein